MSRESEFFLASRPNVARIQALEMSHPAWSKVYRIQPNVVGGVQVTLESASDGPGNGAVVTFGYFPVQITSLGARDNLDSGIRVDLADLGEVLPLEFDRMATWTSPAGLSGMEIKPTLIYRTFRSDELALPVAQRLPLAPPLILEIEQFAFKREGCTFEAKAPSVNIVKTGEIFTVNRFPGLRGFLAT